jgi:hypothetical protein
MSQTSFNQHINLAQKESVTVTTTERGECLTVEFTFGPEASSIVLYLWGTDEEKWAMLDAITDACAKGKRAMAAAAFAKTMA